MIKNAGELARTDRHREALDALTAGIEAAHPRSVLPHAISFDEGVLTVGDTTYDLRSVSEVYLIGGGKPAGAMAAELESELGDRLNGGAIVTDQAVDTDHVSVTVGSHPLPDGPNRTGTDQVIDIAEGATEDDLVIVVLGGGGSALLYAPVSDLADEPYRQIVEKLMQAGASIEELNAVRKHLSRIKGGRLANAIAPAQALGLICSDVVGNHLDVIASGPIAGDPTTFNDALAVLEQYEIRNQAVHRILATGARGDRPETPTPNDAVFDRIDTHVLVDNGTAVDAAIRCVERAGYRTVSLSTDVQGEAAAIGQRHADQARSFLEETSTGLPPVAIVSGGEVTVSVDASGIGGPNQEYALAAGHALAGQDVLVASVDTDGFDGPTPAAGAILDAGSITDAGQIADALAEHDSYTYCADNGHAIETGVTGTNVNDLRVILVGHPQSTS